MADSKAFKEYDPNGDGSITVDEAQAVLVKKLGFTKDQTLALMTSFDKNFGDKNFDGKICEKEFPPFNKAVQAKVAELDKARKEFDSDGDGIVTLAEAQAVCAKKYKYSAKDVEALIKSADKNFDGKISRDEFPKFWNAIILKQGGGKRPADGGPPTKKK